MSKDNTQRAVFATKIGAVAATVGSAVGLGNIWRFPYETGVHGGGAFIACYIVFVLVLGVPLLCAEFMLGRGTRSNILGAFRHSSPSGRYWVGTGYMVIIASVMILWFYSVVAGWTLGYCYDSVTGVIAGMDTADIGEHFAEMTSGWRNVVLTLVFLTANAAVLLGGVTKGIERASNLLMPLLFVLLLVLCVNSLSLDGLKAGLTFLFRPDFSKITSEVLLGAMGQAFFSLSIGMGCMTVYASYFNKDSRLGRTAMSTALLDTMVAILAGVIIFPAVFTYGFSHEQGPALVFQVLPVVFGRMPGGMIWSSIFFLLLIVASLTSTVSLSEISISYFSEDLKMSRRKATLVSTAIVMAGATICALSFGPLGGIEIFGLSLFDALDFVTSNICLPLAGLAISLYVGWVVPKKFTKDQMTDAGAYPFAWYGLLMFVLRWVCPVAITLIFLNSIGLI
ncbi:MAG: sodium-dependent transporter [Bacteroidales bacterium]|nr:sodium-dependent transporter [Bacteroidales bacterium]